MDEQTRQRRVLNLLSRVDREHETLKQWAVRKLLDWQPGAQLIRFEGRCPISRCRCDFCLTYQIPGIDWRLNGTMESCGWYCPSCQFSNAGGRPIQIEKRGQ